MFTACIAITALVALALLGSAAAKLTRQPMVVEQLTAAGVPDARFPQLAGLEIAGAAGMLLGLKFAGLGVLAGICVVLYFVGAVVAHLRANDKQIAGAVVLGLLAAAAVALRISTM